MDNQNMTKEDAINLNIKASGADTNLISDGYHTFAELYEHRITLFIALCKMVKRLQSIKDIEAESPIWRSKKHSDGSEWDGWFIMGIALTSGKQITYHLPISKWDETGFCDTRILAPEWDGHLPADVLERLKQL